MGINNNLSSIGKLFAWIVGLLLILSGLFFTIAGVYLITLGGSWYFAIMGIAMLVAGYYFFKLKPFGAWLYGIAYVLTIVWAIWEVGFEYWPLLSRLAFLGGIAMLVAFAYPSLRKAVALRPSAGGYKLGGIIALLLVISVGLGFMRHNVIPNSALPEILPVAQKDLPTDWQQYANTTKGTRFSGAEQITKNNINQLEVAWTFRTGDIPQSNGSGAEDQSTPLQIKDTVYLCTATNIVYAVDADTGEQRWKYDPHATAPNWQRCRGLSYYEDATTSRIIMNTIDARLVALDSKTGELIESFGDHGVVDLTKHMGEIKPGYYEPTAAPLVAKDMIVIGGRVADNFSTDEPGGVVRAFNVITGQQMWAWDPGNEATTNLPADGVYTRSSVNVWATLSYDPDLDKIYAATGNPTPDFYGAQRTETDEKHNSSVVALDRQSGRVDWVYQTVHHDLWDYDLPSQPLLYDIPNGQGGVTKALVQTTKSGEIFLLNRETGTPIAEVEEIEVPQGNVEGERYSATQPYSVGMPSIGNETLTEADMWGATPFDQLLCRIDFVGSEYQGLFTPPGMNKTLQYPGSLGGMNWGSVSVDPTTGYMFVNDMRIGLTNWMVPRDQIPQNASGIEMGIVPQEGTPFGAMRKRFMSVIGVPCQAPPYGTMTAIDLRSQQIAWQVPVGTVMDTGVFGIPMHLPMPIGMPTLGGSMATKSGLLFFAGTQDFYLRAFDSTTGAEIWKARLPVGSQGTPMTYVSPATGRQYVVISAGGARQSPERGDYVIAYALPK
ncbi:membrane-bound PQQ-dependent dehydrogenase, glucose/quinate/shikimate family [Zophobihabitans entericus]|uniref:Membrane-bound PQQ-dependent dehydrogenase, glucose/quinate/shikimate family n=1 Tax=Zophobihabitans entericus TaxID=1635327 RepID=A0A6G9ICS1_9GAMM|nr:membrane-bound PQQ-dependent dehydrogenase, glucose/quinate/shikimate family [Zophobihabitans entericus]QIQ22031.1 membrane-bound PQQ-dependent dehydrogenase, glucose/quinate/shikimate family [Zophobihabitans entericus]